jgi:hypothetical protein
MASTSAYRDGERFVRLGEIDPLSTNLAVIY